MHPLRLLGAIFLFLFWANIGTAQTLTARQLVEPPHPVWLDKDALLKTRVTVNVKSMSLQQLFAAISARTKAPLSASPRLMNFRVSISSQARPLSEVMMHIQDLMHHESSLADTSCFWQRNEQKEGQTTYLLMQSRKGLADEEENAGTPVQTLVKWLRDVREYARIAPEKRRAFKTDFPFLNYYAQKGESMDDEYTGPLTDAVETLTDTDLEMLARMGRVNAPNFTLSPQQVDAITKVAQKTGFYNPKFNQPPTGAYLQFQPTSQSGRFSLNLAFASGSVAGLPSGFNFDTLDVGGEYDWIKEMLAGMEREEQDKPVELIDPQKRAGRIPVVNVATALELWSKATGRNTFGEIFLREKNALPTTSDKPETLLTRICIQFGYDWRKIGSDYLIYDKSWAADRASDITDALLDKWHDVIKKEGRIPLDTLLEMSTLRNAQFATLENYLNVDVFRKPQNVQTLRLLNTLNATRRGKAETDKKGVSLYTGEEKVHSALAALFPKAGDFSDASLRLEMQTEPNMQTCTITVTLASGESQFGYFSLAAPQASKRGQ